jgi:hypothetical protein
MNFFVGLGLELRASLLKSRCYIALATSPVCFGLVILEIVGGGVSQDVNYLLRLASIQAPDLRLLGTRIMGVSHQHPAGEAVLYCGNTKLWSQTKV